MPKTIRNQYDKKLTYESLMKAHIESRKGKNIRKEIILFNLKQEEYIMWLYEQLKNGTYKHSRYATFYVTEPKLRLIEKSAYIDRIVHRWYVDNFMKEYFIKSFINTSYACLENRGMHKACINVQNTMKHCKRIWNNYYIIKEKAIMNYTMEFDTYTILTEKFKETYDKSGDEYKCQMNVDKFFQMINRKDYKTSYKCLADSYKNNYFKTENDFANFVKSNFYKYNKITFKKSEQKGNRLYSFEIELTDITGKNTETKKVNVIMQLKDNYDFVMSFSM